VSLELNPPGIERLVAAGAGGPLLAGLLWRAPQAGHSRLRALQEARALTTDASHFAQAQAGAHLRYGMYQARAAEETLRLPRSTHSVAACFARLVAAVAPNAALVLSVPAGGQRKEDKYVVVCLDDGVPVVDVLCNEVEARNALGAEARPMWSDNPVAYPNSEAADFAWLAQAADKSTRVLPIPINPWPWVMGLAALALVGGGWSAWHRLQQAAQLRQQAEAARAADPLPRYLQALAQRRPGMASDRAALVSAVARLFEARVWVPGWQLASAECSAVGQSCQLDWVRKGGTYEDLRRALPGARLEVLNAPGGGAPLLDRARMHRSVAVPRIDLIPRDRPLAAAASAFEVFGPQLQVWRTADVVLEFKRAQLWPRLADAPPGFLPAQGVMAGEVEMRNVPGPFILEALRDAPPFISWETVHVDLGDSGDARGALKFMASGVFYVAAR